MEIFGPNEGARTAIRDSRGSDCDSRSVAIYLFEYAESSGLRRWNLTECIKVMTPLLFRRRPPGNKVESSSQERKEEEDYENSGNNNIAR